MGLRHGFKAEANRIALRVRDSLGLSATDAIDPVVVCEHFDIDLIALSSLECKGARVLGVDGSCFSAVTVPRGVRTAIVHNDFHHPHRRRSNICHELAHCFLGHEGAPPLTGDGSRSRDPAQEEEAHFLGGALLITNEAALHIITEGLTPYAGTLYGVSQAMLDYRLRVSGAHTIHGRRVSAGRAV
ncbi:MAG: hypothetical protein DI565_15920 [Ancylobacter novellus]|uniref:IrrE N-terminal-like domain-containing protein n=1 Tax=Ancylobacter novellus TaxID=921 RepID=A0A2W5K8K3_ANCNO|nr:MAG: hypothetical protein DI565_15920 [Ancylobacter novellus]